MFCGCTNAASSSSHTRLRKTWTNVLGRRSVGYNVNITGSIVNWHDESETKYYGWLMALSWFSFVLSHVSNEVSK